jgi:hypothetical protein
MSRRPYRVTPQPNASDGGGSLFRIDGPRLDEFAEMDRVARLLEAALNAASQFEDRAMRYPTALVDRHARELMAIDFSRVKPKETRIVTARSPERIKLRRRQDKEADKS